MKAANLKWIACVAVLFAPQLAQAACFQNVSQLNANNIKLNWRETTANDGKPMTISISNGAGGLNYSATKHGALWMTGNVSVCKTGGATQITLNHTHTTSQVPMLARMAMPRSQSGQIVNNQIRLGGGGWSGTFVGI